jgi:hypothetical protein
MNQTMKMVVNIVYLISGGNKAQRQKEWMPIVVVFPYTLTSHG